MQIAGEPVIILRDRDGALRGMSNVCRHRMSTLLEGRGNVRSIVCPYHAWTYNLDGTLRGAPAMARNEGFCKEDVKLPAVRVEDWLGWILVTLNPDAPPPAERAGRGRGAGRLSDMGTYREVFREEFTWDTNWKVLAENFMESYHLPVCHAGHDRRVVDLNADDLPRGGGGVQLSLDHEERHDPAVPGASVEHAAGRAISGGSPGCCRSTRRS